MQQELPIPRDHIMMIYASLAATAIGGTEHNFFMNEILRPSLPEGVDEEQIYSKRWRVLEMIVTRWMGQHGWTKADLEAPVHVIEQALQKTAPALFAMCFDREQGADPTSYLETRFLPEGSEVDKAAAALRCKGKKVSVQSVIDMSGIAMRRADLAALVKANKIKFGEASDDP